MNIDVLMIINEIDDAQISNNKIRIENIIKDEYDFKRNVKFSFVLDNKSSVKILNFFIELKKNYKNLILECFVDDKYHYNETILNNCDIQNKVEITKELYKTLIEKNKDIIFISNDKINNNQYLNMCKEKNKSIILIKI